MTEEDANAWKNVSENIQGMRNIVEKHDDLQKEIEEWDATLNDGLNDLPWSEEDDKIHTIGGLTNDKESGFMDFQKQQDDNDMERLISEEWDEDHALDQVLNDMVEDLDDEEQTQNTSSLPPVDLIEKQQQTNIPASGLINSPTEISNVTLEGKGSAQRKIRIQQKKKD